MRSARRVVAEFRKPDWVLMAVVGLYMAIRAFFYFANTRMSAVFEDAPLLVLLAAGFSRSVRTGEDAPDLGPGLLLLWVSQMSHGRDALLGLSAGAWTVLCPSLYIVIRLTRSVFRAWKTAASRCASEVNVSTVLKTYLYWIADHEDADDATLVLARHIEGPARFDPGWALFIYFWAVLRMTPTLIVHRVAKRSSRWGRAIRWIVQ